MTISEMIIPMSGGDMYAVHTVVPGAEHRPLVILCHGLMMNCSMNPICGVAECLSMAGYDTIRFDFRGSGRSRGDISKMTPLTESADLLDIIRYACSIVNADRKIVLCGHSLGGLVSMLTAAGLYGAGGGPAAALTKTEREALKSRIAGLALLAPAVNAEADSCAGKVGLETFDPDNIPDLVEVWGSELGSGYFHAAQNLHTYDVISKYGGPVCVIMGERDRLVAPDLAERIAEALPQAELHVIPHGDHLFSRNLRVMAAEIIQEFLQRLDVV